MSSPLPLRIAMFLAALGLLLLAVFGALQSVRINWQFGQTLAPPAQAIIIASLLAAIEVMRIGMPFAAKGLELAGLPNKHARIAFWLFTVISVLSCAAYFKMNRDAAGDQRVTEMRFTSGFKSELRDINTRLERELTRSVGQVEAEIKSLGRGEAARRAELEDERAAILQRPKDLKRLAELQSSDVWKVTVTGKDVQARMIADMLPVEDRAAAERWVALALILLVILAIEFAVGRTPFAAVMIMAWACRRPEVQPAAKAEPAPAIAIAAPTDHVARFVDKCTARGGSTQFRPLYEAYLNYCVTQGWQPLSQFHFRPAMQLVRGGPIETEKRRDGMFWLDIQLKPEWARYMGSIAARKEAVAVGGAHAAA